MSVQTAPRPLTAGHSPDVIYRGVVYNAFPGDAGLSMNDLVTRDDVPLNPRYDLRQHSPTGFAWGYGGSGPSQLALALVSDRLGPGRDQDALAIYQDFKWYTVARWPKDRNWIFSGSELDGFIDAVIRKMNAIAEPEPDLEIEEGSDG